MASAITIQISEEVRSILSNAFTSGIFSMQATVVRQYIPMFEKTQAGVQVTVVAKSRAQTRISRNTNQEDHDIEIGIQKNVGEAAKVEEIDPLTLLMDEIGNYLQADDANGKSRGQLATDGATLIALQSTTLYSMEHLKEKQTFTGVLTATYRTNRRFR